MQTLTGVLFYFICHVLVENSQFSSLRTKKQYCVLTLSLPAHGHNAKGWVIHSRFMISSSILFLRPILKSNGNVHSVMVLQKSINTHH